MKQRKLVIQPQLSKLTRRCRFRRRFRLVTVMTPQHLQRELRSDLLGPRARYVSVVFLGRCRDWRDTMFTAVRHAASAVLCRPNAASRVPTAACCLLLIDKAKHSLSYFNSARKLTKPYLDTKRYSFEMH